MSEELKCPCCGGTETKETFIDKNETWACASCLFQCPPSSMPRISAAMELAKATRTLEDAMEPLNSGKLKMGQGASWAVAARNALPVGR